ncbi:adenosylcobinamide-phosphate synthase CbiB [Jannaschia aquimarina]|uniref:Cobalamin biosynthesis protein CobD n=1 Tax=Jannaschia aquimarina TaxID=935700 RepID=A0A0D1EL21_9RHOB|nr:adenosylcobinamide-phosphate synthase CbiB [Jannaschia aquimarina]KIT16440.1 Cobalamin biosynthesis protein CbiB [Jannaschia aquimarina]SNS92395.1 adenosylcobinamide-phosphate synthase [Jannaschia aquimarina]
MTLSLALLLDALLGEPDWLWRRLPHPAVLMGRAVEALDARWNHADARRWKGIAALAILVGTAGFVGWTLAALHPALELLVAAVLLAQRSLVEHVRAVARALAIGLPAGRKAVAMIVGRDTADMDEQAVARAAIESAAENLSDGVIAPAFWFAVGGLPAMAAYKMVNTADSTVGYRTPRHADFGWASARLDDVLNWIPARLTAGFILLSTRTSGAGLSADSRLHRSPNAGWPEAAMARALNVALAGPRSYDGTPRDFPWVHPEGRRDPGRAEIDGAVRVLWRTWLAALLCVAIWEAAPHVLFFLAALAI